MQLILPFPGHSPEQLERVKTILNYWVLTSDHSPVFIISEAHLMGFELRNEKLENFQEDEEIDLEEKQMWVSDALHMAMNVEITLGLPLRSLSM